MTEARVGSANAKMVCASAVVLLSGEAEGDARELTLEGQRLSAALDGLGRVGELITDEAAFGIEGDLGGVFAGLPAGENGLDVVGRRQCGGGGARLDLADGEFEPIRVFFGFDGLEILAGIESGGREKRRGSLQGLATADSCGVPMESGSGTAEEDGQQECHRGAHVKPEAHAPGR